MSEPGLGGGSRGAREPVAELTEVSRVYRMGSNEVAALDHFSFTFRAGEYWSIMGASGSGKSTLLNILGCIDRPSSGSYRVSGTEVASLSDDELSDVRSKTLGFVFQSYNLIPQLDVLENILVPLFYQDDPPPDGDERARRLAQRVGLGDRLEHKPTELSGGQQQRVAIARALVLEPRVLLFDEPLSNLDARLRRQMREEIRALQQRLGITVVYVTHDQEEALGVSDRIIVMNHAVVAQEGGPRDLYEAPDDVFVAGFMGEANRVKGVLKRIDDRTGAVTIGGLTRMLPHRGLPDGTVDVAIRPEAVLIATDSAGDGVLRGTVRQAAYLGSRMEYSIACEIGELFVTSPVVDAPLAPGAVVGLTLAARGITLIRP